MAALHMSGEGRLPELRQPMPAMATGGVEFIESRCWLDWWANATTMLGCFEAVVVITTTEAGWAADGCLVDTTDDEREYLDLLCDLDPVFTLRFDDGSMAEVVVHSTDGHDRFRLTELASWR
ncbi:MULTISPECIES: hypothetical protein [unclassified Micromonospora]|uniref:hypothetical protein n=1 Tax=unclassified Micromonospora TaxID=2617518 RepID=UPI0022BBB81D|nr:hypothetical protein [Micromonospora sp. AKA38]GHJ17676.1 hypothetical protein TPA0908_56710 [Micromonospora sp. AKA38]